MSSPDPAASPVGPYAGSVPSFDPASIINAGEQQLADYLAMPTQQLLGQFGLPQMPQMPTPAVAAPANQAGALNHLDPTQLISPVVQALSTLGNGGFPGLDPTSMLNGISTAFDGTSGPMQQALGAVGQGWQGASSAAAAAKTSAALANGAQVATQSTGLQNSLSTAAADVAQAQSQLIAIINEFMATLSASLPALPFSLPTIIAAANQAVTQTAQVMTELQSSLAAQASAVTAIGQPINVTSAPQLGGALGGLGSMLGLGSSGSSAAGSAASSAASPMSALSAASPLMYGAMAGISPAMSAISAAGRAGGPAATDPATLAHQTAADANTAAVAGAFKPGGAGGPIAHAAGGGAGSSGTLVSRLAPPMPPTAAEAAPTTIASAPTRPAMASTSMGGGGMMGAPMAGASQAANAGGAHTAASFLHTSDQGGKLVGNRATVAPPVIGETDPHEIPDIELRI